MGPSEGDDHGFECSQGAKARSEMKAIDEKRIDSPTEGKKKKIMVNTELSAINNKT